MRFLIPALAILALTACETKPNVDVKSGAKPKGEAPAALIVRVATSLNACQFKAGQGLGSRYQVSAEPDSYSGRPRLLIVERRNPDGLPKLVVEAQRRGGSNSVSTYGPLLQTKSGPALKRAVDAYVAGRTSCIA